MFPCVYVEKEVLDHPRVKRLCKGRNVVPIERYGEVFNRKAQNFRLQKQKPSLILAKKYGRRVLDTPEGYTIGSSHNVYFSHILNCPFDCRYCFLQGMYNSAHFVFFVNNEDFMEEITHLDSSETTFFTGYDCDSLAFEAVTGFVRTYLPFIAKQQGLFEFRTKSTAIQPFLERDALPNVVIAYTLTPKEIGEAYEHRAPSLEKRLQAIEALQERGWQIGLRFDPMLKCPEFEKVYRAFFAEVFGRVKEVHSVTLGGFRAPKAMHRKMVVLYPEEPLFARDNEGDLPFCEGEILTYIPRGKLWHNGS